jgi:hypothetical protein
MFVYVRYILNRAVGRSENPGGGGNINVLGIYYPLGCERVN